MSEKEIREKYPPREVSTQLEFERIMSDLNVAQTHLNHPFVDRDSEISCQRENIKLQIQALRQQESALKMEHITLEQKRKEINRVFHDIKHELIMLNPLEKFAHEE